MANSETDIINFALDYLGTKNIVNKDDNTNIAKICNKWYDTSRRSVLKDLNASFSIKRIILAESDYVPAFGFSNSFTLPADCLKVLTIGDENKDEPKKIEGNKLYCDYRGSVNLKYIADIKDVTLYDDDFVKLLAIELAKNICMPMTQDIEKANYYEQLLTKKYIETSSKYGNDNKIIVINKPRYRSSKYYNGDLY